MGEDGVLTRLSPSALLLGNRGRKVGILFRHPIHEFANIWIGEQTLDIHAMALQFGIREIGDQRLLANAVHWHDISPAPAFRDWVMPHNYLACQPSAQPAMYRLRSLFLGFDFVFEAAFGVFARHGQPNVPSRNAWD